MDMQNEDIKSIREKFEMSRDQFAEFLCISHPRALANIEIGFRNPNRFTLKFLKYLDSLPKKKAMALIQEFMDFKE